MKLQAELDGVIEKFKELSHQTDLQKYVDRIKASGEFNNLRVRIAWDFLHGVVSCRTMCDWYSKYGCNDRHIETLALKALDTLNLKF